MAITRKHVDWNALTKEAPEEGTNNKVISRFNEMDEKSWANTVLDLGTEPAALVTMLLMSGTTTKLAWNKIQDSYKKGNIQWKLKLLTQLHTIKKAINADIQDHMTKLEKLFVSLACPNNTMDEKD